MKFRIRIEEVAGNFYYTLRYTDPFHDSDQIEYGSIYPDRTEAKSAAEIHADNIARAHREADTYEYETPS